MFLPQRNQLVDLQCKSIDWLLHKKFPIWFQFGFYIKNKPLKWFGMQDWNIRLKWMNPFLPNVSFWSPLKTSDNQRFSDVFRGVKKEHWKEKGYWQKQQNATSVFLLLHLNMYRIMLCSFYWWPCLTHFMPLDCFYTSWKY